MTYSIDIFIFGIIVLSAIIGIVIITNTPENDRK